MQQAHPQNLSPGVIPPNKAATLILLDRDHQDGPCVLLGKRHANHKFLPNFFVFPGGRIEKDDEAMPFVGKLYAPDEAKLLKSFNAQQPSPKAYALAAIRETFEETGIIIGQAAPEHFPPLTASFSDSWTAFAAQGALPNLSQLYLIARAITPTGFKIRFDALFFCAMATDIFKKIDGVVHDGAELTELVWAPLKNTADFKAPLVTQFILNDIRIRLKNGFPRDYPMPFYFPLGDKMHCEEL